MRIWFAANQSIVHAADISAASRGSENAPCSATIHPIGKSMGENRSMFAEQYGPWALIAGGSEGVGESFALKLAAQGINLMLIARKAAPLEALAGRIRKAGSVEVRTLVQDLTAPDMLDRVTAATADIDIGLLIYNAGSVSHFSPFLDDTLDETMRMVRLGVVAPTKLAHYFGAGMRRRGRGGIILMGSMAGYAGAPDEIVYSAGKAYSRMLAEGLWYELKPYNVHVLGLIMGLTRTPAMDRLGLNMNNPAFPPDESDMVADEGFAHLADGPIWNVGGKAEAARFMSSAPRAEAVGFMAKGAKDLHG
jgi:short-subunit dehydrogenase